MIYKLAKSMWAKEIHWNSLALLRISLTQLSITCLVPDSAQLKLNKSYKLATIKRCFNTCIYIHVFQGQDGYKWRGGPDTQNDRLGVIAGWEDCVEHDHHKIKCKCSLCTRGVARGGAGGARAPPAYLRLHKKCTWLSCWAPPPLLDLLQLAS